jgi:hypothetical protein
VHVYPHGRAEDRGQVEQRPRRPIGPAAVVAVVVPARNDSTPREEGRARAVVF